jgi:uncharacterized Zn finger protein (UPF0148 family)
MPAGKSINGSGQLAGIIMWKVECPNCHHLFSVVTEENKNLIDDEKAEDLKENAAERVKDVLEDLVPLTMKVPGSVGTMKNVDDLTYEYKFRCKHCGYEWTELKEKERLEKS